MKNSTSHFVLLIHRSILVLTALALVACEKDEIPVAPFERGEAVIAQVSMGPLYRDQVWYSLERNEMVAVSSINDWDIALSSDPESHGIYLNDARLMYAWRSPHTDITTAADTAGYGHNKQVEAAAKFHTAPAMKGMHPDEDAVYLIDLGFTETGQQLGFCWLQVVQSDADGYSLRSKPFGQSQITEHNVTKDPARMLVRYSLRDVAVPPTAPPDADWDVVFTKYTFSFDEPAIDYLVTGVLLNPAGVQATEIYELPFASIDIEAINGQPLLPQLDAIGYDWKAYSFDIARFTVDSERSFVIRAMSGLHYKIRFVDFYDDNGAAGAPKWESVVI